MVQKRTHYYELVVVLVSSSISSSIVWNGAPDKKKSPWWETTTISRPHFPFVIWCKWPLHLRLTLLWRACLVDFRGLLYQHSSLSHHLRCWVSNTCVKLTAVGNPTRGREILHCHGENLYNSHISRVWLNELLALFLWLLLPSLSKMAQLAFECKIDK